MPFDPIARVKPEDVNQEESELKNTWSEAHAAMKRADDHFFLQNNIWAAWEKNHPGRAGQRPNSHSGRGKALIDHAVAAQLALFPQFIRDPTGKSDINRRRADAVEKGLTAVFEDAFDLNVVIPSKVNGAQLLRHNYTQLWVTLDFESLDRPKQKTGESQEDFEFREWIWDSRRLTWNPIRIDVPQPGTILMPPGDKIPPIAIVRKTLKAYELKDLVLTKLKQGREGNEYSIEGDSYDDIDIIERWSPRYVVVLRSGKLLYAEDNEWGLVPGVQVFGGAADQPIQKTDNPSWHIKQSMLWGVMEPLEMADQAYVAYQNIVQRKAWAKMGTPRDPAEMAEQVEGDMLWGEVDDLWLEKTPDLAPQSYQQLGEILKTVEDNTYNLQVIGVRQPGVATATEQMILAEGTNRIFRGNVRQLESIYSIGGSYAMRLLFRAKQLYGEEYANIVVGERSLKVEDMEKRFHIKAKYETVDIATLVQEKGDARADLDAGYIDRATYYKKARYENVAQIKEGLQRDLIWQIPEVLEAWKVVALKEAGYMELARKKEQQIKAAQLLGPDGNPIGSTTQPTQPIVPQGSNGRAG